MKIAISGSSGLIGSRLIEYFSKEGHETTPIARSSTPLKSNRKVIRWTIEQGTVERDKLEGYDVVINLSGANLAQRRWTNEYKKIMRESRLLSTEVLCENLAQLKNPPKVLFSASAVGYYGASTAVDLKDETSARGKGFLADVCEAWERATQPAAQKGIRVIHMRLGMVLSKKGGALSMMLPIFKMGLGGRLGSGNQMISWIALEEIPHIIHHIIQRSNIQGPVNFVSPQCVTNGEFTKILGEVIKRPTVFPVPAFAVRLLFGEMGDELLLNGASVVPVKLAESGYKFTYGDLKEALKT